MNHINSPIVCRCGIKTTATTNETSTRSTGNTSWTITKGRRNYSEILTTATAEATKRAVFPTANRKRHRRWSCPPTQQQGAANPLSDNQQRGRGHEWRTTVFRSGLGSGPGKGSRPSSRSRPPTQHTRDEHECHDAKIINLLKRELNTAEKSWLEKGPKFTPTPSTGNPEQLTEDLKEFQLRLVEYLNSTEDTDESLIRNKS